jgi:hypothetical protein
MSIFVTGGQAIFDNREIAMKYMLESLKANIFILENCINPKIWSYSKSHTISPPVPPSPPLPPPPPPPPLSSSASSSQTKF